MTISLFFSIPLAVILIAVSVFFLCCAVYAVIEVVSYIRDKIDEWRDLL